VFRRLARQVWCVADSYRIIDVLRRHARWIGLFVAAAIVAGAIAVLVDQLDGIDLAEVWIALLAHPPGRLAAAATCVLCAFATLTLYDRFALRTIGADHVPYRIAALASFASYSIGHNIGATAFSGGAIRYRIYSAFGLSVIDVAKICFLTGLTFWLGNAAMLGIGMICDPDAAGSVDQLPAWINRTLGIAALCALAGYLAWVAMAPRRIGQNHWSLTLPSGRSTLVQIMIGIADLSFCSLAMYMLMPIEPRLGFVTIAVVFVASTLLGFASHAPGSLGVFDAAMVFAFSQVDKEELVAALLLFRLFYFLIPFATAMVIMSIRETVLMFERRRVAPPNRAE
jgi:glycosyltransferase 2 family protein